jgi:hypothetical protein
MGSFLLNVELLGPSIWGLKFVNLLLHLLNGTLVYALFRVFAANGGLAKVSPDEKNIRWMPLLAAALWLLHPLFVSTVLYVIQRMAMLSALFTLLAMLAYVHGRMSWGRGERTRAAWLLASVPIATVLAALSKENGVLAVPLCGLLELMLFAPAPGSRRSVASRTFVGITLLLPTLVAFALIGSQSPLLAHGYANRPFTMAERLLTQPRVLWDYISSLVLPVGPTLGLYHDDYVVSHGLIDPPSTVIAISAWVAVVCAAWYLRRAIPGIALGVGIFLIGQAMESSALPLLMYFEHRNYLPAIGIVWAVVSLLCWLGHRVANRMHHGRQVFGIAGACTVLVFAIATAARAGVWQTERGILMQGLTTHPESRWLRMDAARWAMQQSPALPDQARMHMDHLSRSPDATTRRIAATMRLVIDCTTGARVRDTDISNAFDGALDFLEADALLAVERLADLAADEKCKGLSGRRLAQDLAALVDRSGQAADEYNLRRLRFKSAQLHARNGELEAALEQATLAYRASDHEGPIPAFIAQLDIAAGKYREAALMLDAADAATSADDTFGKQVIAGLRAQLHDRTRAR